MELKSSKARSAEPPARAFQSYLHGIEIETMRVIISNTSGSNRTFMELKLDAHLAFLDKYASSNRTFMELKFIDRSVAVTEELFQSYLHGIEIC